MICDAEFRPSMTTQKVCNWKCALENSRLKQIKAFNEETKKRKAKMKTKADYTKEAQQAFNEFIRTRDNGDNCISCGREHKGQYHAGHYRTTKAAPQLRFHPMNCFLQCQPCNTHLSGNIIEYRKVLKNKIGNFNLEWLESNQTSINYSKEDLIEIKRWYKERTKYLKELNPFDKWTEGLED